MVIAACFLVGNSRKKFGSQDGGNLLKELELLHVEIACLETKLRFVVAMHI